MNNRKKKLLLCLFLFALVLLFVPTGTKGGTVQASSRTTRIYKKRAKVVKKKLPKKVKKLLKKGYYRPSCHLDSSRRKGKYLISNLSGSIGDGAYMIRVKTNLKNGKCHVIENMVSIPDYFKVSIK